MSPERELCNPLYARPTPRWGVVLRRYGYETDETLVGAGLATANAGWLFALSAFFYALSFAALHWWVREPRFVEAVS